MRKTFLSFLLFLIFICSKTQAQSWSALGYGTNGAVKAIAGDTVSNILYVGGNFTDAGGVTSPADNIAEWSGTTWSPLGNGINSEVNALTMYDGKLIAAGQFDTAGEASANDIAEWNGSSWSTLGSGISLGIFNGYIENFINALTVYNGNLIVAGEFDTAGGMPAKNIAEWNGTSWSTLGSGINGEVLALTIYNGKLIAAGYFDTAGEIPSVQIAEWNGTSWSALSNGITFLRKSGGMNLAFVSALAVYNGNLIVAGQYDSVGDVPANNISEWNDISWSSLSYGVTVPTGNSHFVQSLTVLDGNLYVGGLFSEAGLNITVNNIAEWNGTSWSQVDSGMNNQVNSLAVLNGNLYAGGNFLTTVSGKTVNDIAELSNATGVKEISVNDKIIIYPNPNTGKFFIDLYNVTGETEIEAYNAFGERIYKANINSNRTEIDLSSFPAGIYFYKILNGNINSISDGKIVVQ